MKKKLIFNPITSNFDYILDETEIQTSLVHKSGDETIAGNKTFSNNLIITGNLTVNGTTTAVNSTNMEVKDNQIVLNKGETGAGVSSGIAGLKIDRGSLTSYDIIFDESDNRFKIGQVGSYQMVATREDNPLNNGYAKWNNTTNKFITDSYATVLANIGGAGLSSNNTFTGTNIFNANIGLGVTPSAWYANSKVMQIGSGAAFEGRNNDYTIAEVSANQYLNSAGTRTYLGSAAASLYEQNAGQHRWYTAPSGTAGNAITFTQVMTLDASGKLGIGTSSPSEKLAVNGGIVSTSAANLTSGAGLYMYYTSSTTSAELTALNPGVAWLNQKYNALTHIWNISGSEKMRIDTSGNLGLGVTPSAWGSSWKTVQVSSSCITNDGFGNTYIGANWYQTGTGDRYINSDFATVYGQVNGAHNWYTAPSGTAGATITFIQAMTLDANGNLALGVSPSAWISAYKAFDIGTSALYGRTDTAVEFSNVINSYRDTAGNWLNKITGIAGQYGMDTTGTFYWKTAPSTTAGSTTSFTQIMSLDINGNLGIGITTPTQKLDVAGNIALRNNATYIFGKTISGTATRMLGINAANDLYIGSIDATIGNMHFQNGTTKMTLDTSGRLSINGVSPGGNVKLYIVGDVVLGTQYTLSSNMYWDTTWKYTSNGYGGGITLSDNTGTMKFFRSGNNTSGAGASATWVESMSIDNAGNLIQTVNSTAPTLTLNNTMSVELTNNTTFKVKVRGSDGVTRSATLTLA